MESLEIKRGGHVFRWAGGSFLAVWRDDRAHIHVPDDMVSLPASLNRSQAERADFERLAAEWLEALPAVAPVARWIRYQRTETTFAVRDAPQMDIGFNPESGQFLPDQVRVLDEIGEEGKRQVRIDVSGPELRDGKPMKARRGSTGWGLEDFTDTEMIEEHRPPVWLRDMLSEEGMVA